MKIPLPILLLVLLPILTFSSAGFPAALKSLFSSGFLKQAVSFISTSAGVITDKWFKIKQEDTKSDDTLNVQNDFSEIAIALKETDKEIKASFKSVKNLMRDQHFQTHIQFPTASLMLHLEQFLLHPSNATEDDLRLVCTRTLPNTILKNIELIMKDNFLSHQSGTNPEIFAKIEKGIVLTFNQLLFGHIICLQLRGYSITDSQNQMALKIAENIEFYVKQQKTEVETKYHLNTVFINILNTENNYTDFKSHDSTLYENIGTELCKKVKSTSAIKNVDIFLTSESSEFTIITENRYFQESFNGWKIISFYPKTVRNNQKAIKNLFDGEGEESEEVQQKFKIVTKNTVVFECNGRCTLVEENLNGMFCNGMQKHFHYSICGNIGVNLGHPNIQSNKGAEDLKVEEKEQLKEWEKTKTELNEYFKAQKIADEKEKENRRIRDGKLIEETVSKVLQEMKEKEELKVAALVSTNDATGIKFNLAFVTFLIAFYYSRFSSFFF